MMAHENDVKNAIKCKKNKKKKQMFKRILNETNCPNVLFAINILITATVIVFCILKLTITLV